MTPERWAVVRELFERLVVLPPAERAPLLDGVVGSDAELRAEVERLLAADPGADTDAGGWVAPGPARWAALLRDPEPTDALRGRSIGRWCLERPLGEGGMGSVWLAERRDGGFVQRAAIKLIRGVQPSPQARARFAAEQRMLARLSHPNVARLIDGGVTEDGLPFLALEYVDGAAIDQAVAAARLDLPAILDLFLEVCAAVAHAHAQLIVHRDLKPSNILVGRDGGVRLLDFGIAKLIGGLDEDEIGLTTTGVRLYTPGYAAPEQLRGEMVGTATDIYALGALLYVLISGRRPHEVASRSPADWERAVLDAEPAPPSRLASPEGGGRTVPRRWRADLDAIVLKALRREPERRYASVADLAADLRALQEGRPVGARRGSRRYRLAKFIRRNALAVGALAAVALALLVGLGVALWQARVAAAERDRALAEGQRANSALAFQREIFRRAQPARHLGQEPTASMLLDVGETLLAEDHGLDDGVRATLLEELSHSRLSLGGLERAHALALQAQALQRATGDRHAAMRLDIHLASIEAQLGRPDEARVRIDRVLGAPPEDALPPEQIFAAWFQHGMLIGNAGDREGAIRAITTAITLASRSDVARPVRPTALIGMEVVRAGYLSGAGRGTEALARLAATRERLAGLGLLDDSGRQQFLQAEGVALEQLGRLEEARVAMAACLALSERIYGADHPMVGQDLAQLARLALKQHDPALARRHGEAALAILRKYHGEGDAWVAGVRNTLALARLRTGDLDGAREHASIAYDARRAALGDTSPRTLTVRATLAMIEEAAGRLDAAWRIATEIRDAAGEDWSKLGADARTRVEAIRLYHDPARPDSRCAALEATRAAATEAAAAPVLGLYLAACRQEAGDADRAREVLAELDAASIDRLGGDPALSRLRALVSP